MRHRLALALRALPAVPLPLSSDGSELRAIIELERHGIRFGPGNGCTGPVVLVRRPVPAEHRIGRIAGATGGAGARLKE
jgi:hypothetical protein